MKTLKKIGLGIILTALAVPNVAHAQEGLKGFFKVPYSTESGSVIPQADAFYNLPGGISGFTFLDFKDGSYFGKTSLTRTISERYGINARTATVHANELHTTTGVGINVRVPGLPQGTFASVSALPIWLNGSGVIEGMKTVDYFVKQELPFGLSATSFGNIDVSNSSPKWIYGEIDVGGNIGPARVSYNPALNPSGGAMPDIEHRVSVAFNF